MKKKEAGCRVSFECLFPTSKEEKKIVVFDLKTARSKSGFSIQCSMQLALIFLAIPCVPFPRPVARRTDGVREVAPLRMSATRFLGQILNVAEQQSVEDSASVAA